MRVASPPVRAPLLSQQRWAHLIVCSTRIPTQMSPFVVPAQNAYHLVMLRSGGLHLKRRGLASQLASADMSAGEVYITAAGAAAYELCWMQPPRELRAVHVLVDGLLTERVQNEAMPRPVKAQAPVAVVHDGLLTQLMLELQRSVEAPNSTEELYVDVLSERLALQLIRKMARPPTRTPLPPGRLSSAVLRRINDYVQAHLDREIRLFDLAREVRLSRYHLAGASSWRPEHPSRRLRWPPDSAVRATSRRASGAAPV